MERKYTSCTNGESFIVFNGESIKKYGINLYECASIMPTTKKFAERWNIPFSKVIDLFIKHNMLDGLFEWNKGYGSKKLVEKGMYYINNIWVHGMYTSKKEFVDMYISEDKYIHLDLARFIPQIIKEYYPWIYLTKEVPLFPNIDKLSLQTQLKDLPVSMTCEDIINLFTNPSFSKTKHTCEFDVYGDSDIIYLPLERINLYGNVYKYSLYIPIEAIIKRDWSIVENLHVGSIIKRDANKLLGNDHNNWYDGIQKNSPYFSNPRVNEVKSLFIKNK